MAFAEFPKVAGLGEQSKFKEYDLKLKSHTKSEIRLVGNQVDIEIGYENPVRTLAVLKTVPGDEEREDCIFIQNKEKVVEFKVTIPEKGFWKLEIYAAPSTQEGDQLIGVYNYIIHCPKVIAKPYPLPKRYKQWCDGCYLYDPLVLHKDVRGPSVHFRVRVPKANSVAVCINGENPWIHLKKEHEEAVIWEGNVKLADYYGRNVPVTVNARYGKDSGSTYTTLLQYTI